MTKEQRLVHYSGIVQGVGFRYTACRLAGGYDVAGYVRNLDDGRVECLVEGEKGQIESFLSELSRRMGQYIRKQTQQIAPFTGQYHDFSVGF